MQVGDPIPKVRGHVGSLSEDISTTAMIGAKSQSNDYLVICHDVSYSHRDLAGGLIGI